MNTLIIGFGKRAKYSILPALKIINEGKVYVYSRDLKKSLKYLFVLHMKVTYLLFKNYQNMILIG